MEEPAPRLDRTAQGSGLYLSGPAGGAGGLDASLRDAAALTFALGLMTWPHMLTRALLAEQLYRAQSILTGHPYHRE